MLGDCHIHIAMDGVDYAKAMALHQERPDEDHIKRVFEAYAQAGITFLRDGGDAYGVSERARDFAGEFGIDYRTPLFAIHKVKHYGRIVGKGFEDIEGYRALVLETKNRGADFIKIMTTGIMDFNVYGRIVVGTDLEAEEVRDMVAIAHSEGMAVMSHTNGKQAVLAAAAAGVDSVEHGNYIDDECLDALAAAGTCLVPTACVARNLIGASDYDQDVLGRIWEQSRDTIARAAKKGVILACGSDGGAVGTLHAAGTLSEFACFADALGSEEAARELLEKGEDHIRSRFSAQNRM